MIDIRELAKVDSRTGNMCLVLSKHEWLMDPVFHWTEEEINMADFDTCLIGSRYGIDCYITKCISVV